MEYTSFRGGDRLTYSQMRQQPLPRDTFFSLKNDSQLLDRPISVATEFVDTDWEEEDEIISDEEDNSPRISLQSAGQPSFTTVSSYDEVPTPRSSRSQEVPLDYSPKQVEGPRGPHLFRNSTDQYSATEEDIILTLSPITPKGPRNIADFLMTSQPPPPRASPFQYTDAELDTTTLASWSTEMVAQAMLNAGVELSVADRFMENDISGAILITLKFEDLKELNIQSFGIRTKVWHQIQALRDSRPASPRPETPIEDVPSKEVVREARRGEEGGLKRRQSSKRRHRARTNGDDITPMESVSIIGIEQVIPKPHHCSKGENCSKFRKQQQLIRAFKKEYPHVDINATGTVMVGDAGNPETAKALDPNKVRPVSDAVPSVVASSDVMGPGMPPLQYLYEASLRGVQSRDPQDNVRQFLSFQHQQQGDCSAEVPPTPPFDGMPTAQAQLPHQGLRRLPKLSIPGKPQLPPSRLGASSKTSPRSPDLEMTPRNSFRHGTPFSELDVPITAVPIGPVARDFSQSVPPDMNYRTSPTNNVSPPRCQSRTSARRPSFPVMPALEENKPVLVSRPSQGSSSPQSPRGSRSQQPLQPPPRDNLPFSRGQLNGSEKVLAPTITPLGAKGKSPSADPANGISHQGPMKKRKTKMLRHEWQDGYFTLKGTRLNMHKDAEELGRTLEYVDIDDYAIACSSVASSSKLTAAFKTMHLSRGSHSREKSDPVGAFAFQLIPQEKNTARLRKRESHLQPAGAIPAEGVNGTGKTHHFAVKNRDDRIDWMRELMLAKALRQKGEGFEISVNGNMI
ncbi:Sterile alpha motif domain [Fusarium oxysporum f. sp. vasinfectum]|nr:Sterile alpha motif domain [Fusarium oxysporum f. sp. vasinfectum]WKT43105.1 Pleckstrin homology domain [Fusarium oxysporum f. sp. vasinfectum]